MAEWSVLVTGRLIVQGRTYSDVALLDGNINGKGGRTD